MADVELLRKAATQWGVVSRAQAEKELTRRQVHHRVVSGRWQRVHPGTFRVEGSARTWQQRLKAVSLWLEKGFVFSHSTAAALWGFTDFEACEPVVLTITRRVRPQPDLVMHETGALHPKEVAEKHGFRVTAVSKTVIDVALERPDQCQRVVDEALRRKWMTLDRLEASLGRTAEPWRLRPLEALVHRYRGGEGPTESQLEWKVLTLLREHGFPEPRPQRTVRVHGRLRRMDFLFEAQRVVLEADGYAWHSDLKAFEADRQRRNQLTARGFRVLEWTWRAMEERPLELLAELAGLLVR